MGNSRPGLWRNDPKLSEGKFPVVLRRDGTIPEWPWFVLGGRDPAAPAALRAYADGAEKCGMAEGYVRDVRSIADDYEAWRFRSGDGDPDKGPHRKDDQLTLRLARGEITMADIAALEARLAASEQARASLERELTLFRGYGSPFDIERRIKDLVSEHEQARAAADDDADRIRESYDRALCDVIREAGGDAVRDSMTPDMLRERGYETVHALEDRATAAEAERDRLKAEKEAAAKKARMWVTLDQAHEQIVGGLKAQITAEREAHERTKAKEQDARDALAGIGVYGSGDALKFVVRSLRDDKAAALKAASEARGLLVKARPYLVGKYVARFVVADIDALLSPPAPEPATKRKGLDPTCPRCMDGDDCDRHVPERKEGA